MDLKSLCYFLLTLLRDSILYGGIVGVIVSVIGGLREISIKVYEVIGLVFCVLILHFVLFSKESLYIRSLSDDEEDDNDE